MKRFFCLGLLNILVISYCSAQTYFNETIFQQLHTKRTHVKALGYFTVDSLFRIPLDTLPNCPVGSIAYKNGQYYAKYTFWQVMGATDTTSLSNRINLKLNISDTSTMLSQYVRSASEGLLKSSQDIRFAGPIGTPTTFSVERTLNINRKIMHWTNGLPSEAGGQFWQFSNRPYSPFQFISQDTIASTGEVLSLTRPLSGLFARRIVHLPSGVYRADEKLYGHYLGITYSFQDSMTAYTAGGDYYQGVTNELRIKPRNNGYSAFRTGHGTGTNLRREEGLSAFIGNVILDGKDDASTDTLHINGTLVGVAPYLVAALGSGKINIDNYVAFQPNSFMTANTKIRNYYDFASAFKLGTNSVLVDSAYLLFDTSMFKRNYWKAKTVIGSGIWSSTDQLKVFGNTNITDSLIVGKATNIADTTGYDIVLRKRTDGSLMRITSTQLASFWGSSGVNAIGAYSTSGNADGASISGSTLTLHGATVTTPGMVTVNNQSWDGNKTFLGITSLTNQTRFESNLRLIEMTTPGVAPPSGYGYLYPKSDGKLYWMDDAGTEMDLTTAGGGGSGTVNSGTANRLAYYPSTGTTVDDLAAITANRAVVSDANGLPTHSATTDTEIGYVGGVTSSIQTQIDDAAYNSLSKRRWYVTASSSTNITTVGTNAATTSGTVANPTIANTNLLTSTRRFTLQTAASSSSAARMNNTSTEVWRGDASGLGGFKAVFRFATSVTAANNRVFIGFANTTSALSNVDHFTNTAIDRVGMYIDANTGNWNIIHNTSGSAATTVGLGANFPVDNTSLYELYLSCTANASSISYTVKNLSTGNTTSGTLSSNLPTASNFLAAHTWINTNTGSTAITLDVSRVFVESNY